MFQKDQKVRKSAEMAVLRVLSLSAIPGNPAKGPLLSPSGRNRGIPTQAAWSRTEFLVTIRQSVILEVVARRWR